MEQTAGVEIVRLKLRIRTVAFVPVTGIQVVRLAGDAIVPRFLLR